MDRQGFRRPSVFSRQTVAKALACTCQGGSACPGRMVLFPVRFP
jgi:hypothetical protein